ncbi:MAG TPA: ADOP family duplicated permease, partial [Thermoanaerobaculia bacterium]|nr:ADOP family duplicated permease [Thermoanaerobaculia bacterium]
MSLLLNHWRRAARALGRAPGFTALCILTLAVGIGADTAVFSLFDAVLLRPLPFPDEGRLVWLGHTVPGLGLEEVGQSDGTYLLYRSHRHALSDLGLFRTLSVNFAVPSVGGGGAPRRLPAAQVTASLFPVLGVAPRLGRIFEPGEEKLGGRAVVLLGDRLWHELGGDPKVLGRVLKIDGVPTEVIGVLPASFAFPFPETELWLPRRLDPERTSLAALNDDGVGRLAPGFSREAAAAELAVLAKGLDRELPGRTSAILVKSGFAPIVKPLAEQQVGDFKAILWVLLGAVGCILAIACANVANLLLVRGEGRQRELAIHAALGAPRRRLLTGVLAESLLLGLAAGLLGTALAWAGLELLAALRPPALSHLPSPTLNLRALAFAGTLAVVTSLLAGLLPAWRASRRLDLSSELKAAGRAMTATRGRQRVRRALVGLQMALAVVLLTGATLMLQSFRRLAAVDLGFRPENVLTLDLALPEADYPTDSAVAHSLAAILERLRALPGVAMAGATSFLPLDNYAIAGHAFEDFPRPPQAPPAMHGYQYVTEDYFRSLSIPILAGRGLERADAERRTGAVVVSEALAKHYWPGKSALGRHLRLERGYRPGDPWYTIVGVAGNIRQRELTETETEESVYYPILAMKPAAWAARQVTLVLRTSVPPATLAPAVRRELARMAPELPLANLRTFEERLRGARSRIEFSALMILLATVIALGLGAMGLYGFV